MKKKGKAQPPKKKLKVKFTFGAAAKPTVSESDGGASAVSRVQKIEEVVEPAETILGDMGMILRDPPVFHLLLHETMRTLQFVVKDERQPKTDARLKKLAKFVFFILFWFSLNTVIIEIAIGNIIIAVAELLIHMDKNAVAIMKPNINNFVLTLN